MNKLKREYQFFKQQTSNVRVLLMTNLLYAFVLPVVEIFVGAYVMRHTSEPVSVAFYQLLCISASLRPLLSTASCCGMSA